MRNKFVCKEQLKCFIPSHTHDRKLSNKLENDVWAQTFQQTWEELDIVMDDHDNCSILTKFQSHDSYTHPLASAINYGVTTRVKDSNKNREKWRILRQQVADGIYSFQKHTHVNVYMMAITRFPLLLPLMMSRTKTTIGKLSSKLMSRVVSLSTKRQLQVEKYHLL